MGTTEARPSAKEVAARLRRHLCEPSDCCICEMLCKAVNGVECADYDDTCSDCEKSVFTRLAELVEGSTPDTAGPQPEARELADMLRRVGDGTNAAMFDLVWALKHEYGFSCGGTRAEEWRHDGFYAIAELVERIAAPDAPDDEHHALNILASTRPISPAEILRRIDSSGEFASMVDLPRDRDGVPIRLGDTVWHDGKRIVVNEMRTDVDGWAVWSNNYLTLWVHPDELTHRPPRTIDDIISELVGASVDECETLAREAYELGRKWAL